MLWGPPQSIPNKQKNYHDDALLTLNWALSRRDDLPHAQKIFLQKALHFSLSHNYFWYQSEFYSQGNGGSYWSQIHLSLANSFMAEWEDRYIFNQMRPQLCFYRRFIDELFFIWEGTEQSLHEFLSHLNSNNNNIMLDYQFSNREINFLDLTMFRTGNDLATKFFLKATDRNNHNQKWPSSILAAEYSPRSTHLHQKKLCF